jgi:hypothetical protein
MKTRIIQAILLIIVLFICYLLFPADAGAQAISVPIAGAPVAPAVAKPQPEVVKGTLNISFDATGTGKIVSGATDKYDFDVVVANSAHFHGSIDRLPYVKSTMGFGGQDGSLTYNITYDLINHKKPTQVARDIGTLSGTVPNDKDNVYRFEDGDLTMNTHAHGRAGALQSKFAGLALGKKPGGGATLQQQALSFVRSIKGNTVAKKVTKYDTMEFRQHILGAGPSPELTAVQVNGPMVYDYDSGVWYFKDITCVYATVANGVQTPHLDTITGSIRWKEDDNRASNGQGEYDFDIRVNEPPPSDDAAFNSKSSDNDDDFFAADDAVPGLSGTMKYVDTIIPGSITKANPDGNVTASAIQIDLKGNQISREQVVYLAKLVLFSAVVPINSN